MATQHMCYIQKCALIVKNETVGIVELTKSIGGDGFKDMVIQNIQSRKNLRNGFTGNGVISCKSS